MRCKEITVERAESTQIRYIVLAQIAWLAVEGGLVSIFTNDGTVHMTSLTPEGWRDLPVFDLDTDGRSRLPLGKP